MARPLRIQFPGAVYHVTSRGNARKAIARNDDDRRRFLSILDQVVTRYHWRCHAYCLMPNHYHLLIETRDENLSRGMRQLNGLYTQDFNRRHHRVGHLFQGRFKAILVQKDSHLLECCRYLMLNPVRTNFVRLPDEWKWSSYRGTAGLGRPHPCLTRTWVLEQFGSRPREAENKYREFVREGIGVAAPWDQVKGQSLLGEDSYVRRLVKYVRQAQPVKEYPRAQRYLGRPALTQLFTGTGNLKKSRRDLLVMAAVLEHGYTQKALADHLDLHYSTVSRLLKRLEKQSSRNKT